MSPMDFLTLRMELYINIVYLGHRVAELTLVICILAAILFFGHFDTLPVIYALPGGISSFTTSYLG